MPKLQLVLYQALWNFTHNVKSEFITFIIMYIIHIHVHIFSERAMSNCILIIYVTALSFGLQLQKFPRFFIQTKTVYIYFFGVSEAYFLLADFHGFIFGLCGSFECPCTQNSSYLIVILNFFKSRNRHSHVFNLVEFSDLRRVSYGCSSYCVTMIIGHTRAFFYS